MSETYSKPLKTAIYCRVSTEEQETQNQRFVLENWAKQRGYEIYKIYSEEESAWKAGHQRELLNCIVDAQKGKYKVLMVWALDRISREGALPILLLVNKLTKWGVKVLSYQEHWTEAPDEITELLYALYGWIARMESKRRSDRTNAGLERVRKFGSKSGKPIGRPKGKKDSKKRKKRTARI